MASHNRIILVGTVIGQPESRVTNAGDPFSRFKLAVDRPTRDGVVGPTDQFQIVAWRQLAQDISFGDGALILVEGRISTRSFEDQEGRRKYVTEVEARDFKLLQVGSNQTGSLNDFDQVPDNAAINTVDDTFVKTSDFNMADTTPVEPVSVGEEELQEEDIPF